MKINDNIFLDSQLHQLFGGVGFSPFQINSIYAMGVDNNVLIQKPSRRCGATTAVSLISTLLAIDAPSNFCIMSVNNALAMQTKSMVINFLSHLDYTTSASGPFGISIDGIGSNIYFCSPGLGSSRVLSGNLNISNLSCLFIDELCYFHSAHFLSFIGLTTHSDKIFCIADSSDMSRYYENLFPILEKPVIIL